MNMKKTNRHTAAIVLFSIAGICYVIGAATPALIFGGIGMIYELAAWITWFGAGSKERRNNV
jgi:hypothetical protein